MSMTNTLEPVSVGTTSTLIYESRNGTSSFPTVLTISIPSGSTVYVGTDSEVTTANGVAIIGTSAECKMIDGETLYGIVAAGTVSVRRMVAGAE